LGPHAHTFLMAVGMLLWLASCVFSLAYSPLGSNTSWPIRRAGLLDQRRAKIELRMIFVVFDFPVRVMPNRAVFWASSAVGVISTGTPDTCWEGRWVEAYRSSPTRTRSVAPSGLARGSR